MFNMKITKGNYTMKASKAIFLFSFIILLLCFYLTPLANAGQNEGWYRFIGKKEQGAGRPSYSPAIPSKVILPIVTGKTHADRNPTVDVYRHYLDTVISYGVNAQMAQGNYPVVALVALVVTEINPDTGKKILFRYIPDSPPLEISCSVKNSDVYVQLMDVTESVRPNINLEETLELRGSGRPGWKGIFYSWDRVTTKAPSILDAPSPDVSSTKILINLTGLSPIVILAVRSWNYDPSNPKLELEVSARLSDKSVPVFPKKTTLPSDVNNVDFVRENCPEGQEATFQGDPGRFVVKGADEPSTGKKRTYDEIGQILADAMKGRISLAGGGGSDWLQVAAAHNYNTFPSAVSNCVRKIIAKDMAGSGWGGEGEVLLNPYEMDPILRFNRSDRDRYSFFHSYFRDGIIGHEAWHNYHRKPGLGWLTTDNDDDWLDTESEPRSIIFSEDSPGRGFIWLSRDYADYVSQFLNGKYGDSHYNYMDSSKFLEDLSLSGITQKILEAKWATFTSQAAPGDLPYGRTKFLCGPTLYAYNLALRKPYLWREGRKSYVVPGGLIKEVGEDKKNELGGNGFYYRRVIEFCVGNFGLPGERGLNERIRTKLAQLDKQGYTLFLNFEIKNKDAPYEWDASIYGIVGNRR